MTWTGCVHVVERREETYITRATSATCKDRIPCRHELAVNLRNPPGSVCVDFRLVLTDINLCRRAYEEVLGVFFHVRCLWADHVHFPRSHQFIDALLGLVMQQGFLVERSRLVDKPISMDLQDGGSLEFPLTARTMSLVARIWTYSSGILSMVTILTDSGPAPAAMAIFRASEHTSSTTLSSSSPSRTLTTSICPDILAIAAPTAFAQS